ncbi:DUF4238 domain-containing protein [Pseudomonas corrugata]|uniref:DUF4238 domain-containing protein n=1 Tax=Pseudomonas corrugata TaxID=47879 RepID=UPI003D81B7DE
MQHEEKKKKKQHYVWRFYLGSWAEDELIYCWREGKIFRPNIKDVAQGRYFYQVKKLSKDEIDIVKTFIEHFPTHLKSIHYKILDTYITPHKLQTFFNLHDDMPDDLNEILDTMIHNLEENLHATVESESIQFIESIRAEDISFWNNRKERTNFLIFIFLQLFRTKKIQENLTLALRIKVPGDTRLINAWGVLRQMFAINVADSVLNDKSYYPLLLLNDSAIPLITADQPVINTHSIGSTLFQEPEQFEVYYPVSPRKAIMLTNTQPKPKSDTIFLTINDVKLYNSYIIDRSHEQVFSTSKEILEQIEISEEPREPS